ncbi:MAG TPA: DUF3617 family protein [Caulobacteraceae bacterium]|nr:DUF3617 family protein [Caulobacteraceae bacterium]
MRKVLLVGLAAVSLGGCGQGLFGGVHSPHRKPGLWEMTLVGDRLPTPVVTKWCFDAESDREMPVLGRRQRRPGGAGGPAPACKVSLSKSGNAYTSDTHCTFNGRTVSSQSVTTGDYEAKYTTTQTIDVEGDSVPARNGKHTVTQTWVYKGECPPELQPGQVERPDGEVVEMASMRAGFGGVGRGGGNAATNAASNAAAAPSQ